MKPVHYSALRDSIQTGDLILFSGEGPVSVAIQHFTKSPWSHIGMAIRSEELDAILLWESTPLSKLKDIDSGQVREGVQIVPLSERIRSYPGRVAVRHLSGVHRGPEFLKALTNFRQEIKGRDYEESRLELLRSARKGTGTNKHEDLSSIFCSEQVAEMYQRWGVLPAEIHSNNYSPARFSSAYGHQLNMLGGELSHEIYLERS